MNATELEIKLDLHLKWIKEEVRGVRANLQEANLRGADLQEANLQGANLQEANLQEADLQEANLQEANLDFSSGLFFGCKSFKIKADLRLAAQIAYHFCRIDFTGCEDALTAQSALKDLANQFHRVEECGWVE